MKDLIIMITAAGAPFVLGLVNCLKYNGERNIKIIGVDMGDDPSISQMVDAFYTVPPVSKPEYYKEILKICKVEKVDIIIPFMSQELSVLEEMKDEFCAIGTIVSVASRNVIKYTNNKYRFYTYLRQNKLAVPRFYPVYSVHDLEKAAEKLGYPDKAICVKLTESSGSRGVRIIDPKKSREDILFNEKPNSFYISMKELKSILREAEYIPEMMAMEFLPGKEMSVDILAEKGKVLYMCGRESNVISASIPLEATLKEDKKAYQICRKVAEILQIDGNADFDFKFDESGEPVLMEVNPRIAATMAVFTAGGLNLPYLRIKQLLGEKLPDVQIQYGVKMKRRYIEMFSDPYGKRITLENSI